MQGLNERVGKWIIRMIVSTVIITLILKVFGVDLSFDMNEDIGKGTPVEGQDVDTDALYHNYNVLINGQEGDLE